MFKEIKMEPKRKMSKRLWKFTRPIFKKNKTQKQTNTPKTHKFKFKAQ